MDQNIQLKNKFKVIKAGSDNDLSCVDQGMSMNSMPPHPPNPFLNTELSHPNSHVIPNIPPFPACPSPPLNLNKLAESNRSIQVEEELLVIDDVDFATENSVKNSEPKKIRPVPKPRPKMVASSNDNENCGPMLVEVNLEAPQLITLMTIVG